MSLTHYAFDKVICIYGAVPITGWFEGDDVITVERNVDTFTMSVGAGGDGIAVRNADRSGKITLKLQQTSPSNVYLAGLLEASERGLFAWHPFVLKDASNNIQLVAAAQCVIVRPTNQTYGANQTVREWSMIAENIVMV